MQLSKNNLKYLVPAETITTMEPLFNLPEKVLQFGTGVLLRGLPDYFIDNANRQGFFNGRIVVVKSTGNDTADFDAQDNLYSLHSSGIKNGREIKEQIICAAVSRVISAGNNWASVLQVARNPELQVIISNTTEVGIHFFPDDINLQPPASFPGKLLAVLHERYKALGDGPQSGMVIIPTELITDNGDVLRSVLLKLAEFNNLELPFINWLQTCNHFCNSLVDRIVPGKPLPGRDQQLEEESGYRDNLRIVAEAYCLWAIEGDEKVASVLSFSRGHKGVVVTGDITRFRELKLRLLNGSHTLSCAIAFLSGFTTVKEAMDDMAFSAFISRLMYREIIPAIPFKIDRTEAESFAAGVLDRFRNPGIAHQWFSIAVQYSAKMKTRILPMLLHHYEADDMVPLFFAAGFAAFLRFMKVTPDEQGNYFGLYNGAVYQVTDSNAGTFYKAWANENINTVVQNIFSDMVLWETDLNLLPGFREAVVQMLEAIMNGNIANLLSGTVA